jgi:hypothetical protein
MVTVLAGIIGAIMFKLSGFMPGYLVVLLFFLLGLVGLGFLIGLPVGRKKGLMKVWIFHALISGSALCLIYAQALHQHQDGSSVAWSVLGWVLGISAFIVLFVSFPDPRKKSKDSEKRDEV